MTIDKQDRFLRIGLQGEIDRERHRLRLARKVAGERDRRSELAERSRPGQHRSRPERRADRGHGHAPERVPPRGAERSRGILEPRVHLAQGGLDGDDEERHRHERLGDDDARGGERQPEVEPAIEILTNEPATTQCEEQGDAADDRREHHRQRAQGAHGAPPTELHTSQQPGERYPEHDRQACCPQRADHRQSKRRQRTVVGQIAPGARPRCPPQQPDQRQREERDRHDRERQNRGRQRAASAPVS